MGVVVSPGAWCRQKWCRDDAAAAVKHFPGDGCTCDPHGRLVPLEEPRVVRLKAQAVRLRAFSCRACGVASRDMVEQPELFFRCLDCAEADRWPPLRRGRA
ncbi:MAG TPA: hypothetical protein VFA98_09675 [Thermoanaerobaculia bacterium]|nr:hypothetical protein [Thermoanaerobaculia bacterium]